MKKCVTALAVAAAVVLIAQDAQAFGKRNKCNTCQTVSTCQPAPASCQSVVTTHANPPTPVVTFKQLTTVIYAQSPTTGWQTVNWPSSCPNGRCPSANR